MPRLPTLEEVVQQARAAGIGEELRAETNQAAGGNAELEPHPARRVRRHLDHPALARRQLLGEHADVFLGRVDHQQFHRLVQNAVDAAHHHLGFAHRQLVPFAPHHFDQDRQLQLAAAGDLEGIGRIGRFDADRNVAQHFLLKAFLDFARGDVFAIVAGEGGIVDAEGHGDRRFVDLDRR